ncbi:hypothetical protein BCR39DRAFT_463060 [Naematelia encephala]|uniref:HAD-like domain-containing protein n=1 Tax=Naematelia encephala TaxID=71784 RepID=A0A1Y2BGT8_9TREE|nr:hypothetical protein BCR39DRAFT_463060 [Naematelia encephala]
MTEEAKIRDTEKEDQDDNGNKGNEEVDDELKRQTDFVETFEADYKGKKNGRVIALDFDDVCAQNVLALITEHNVKFGTDLTLNDYQSYIIFQNRGWGPIADVERKLKKLGNLLPKTAPIPGFVPALRALHAMGHPLHIVTARPESDHAAVIEWLAQQGLTVGMGDDDVIAAAWFTDTYGDLGRPDLGERRSTASGVAREQELNEQLKEALRTKTQQGKGGRNKLKVLRAINASLFIDDHHGNLEPILESDPAIPCLLFGPYAWNRSRSGVSTPAELMTFQERQVHGIPLPREPIHVGDNLWRAETWEDVIKWVRRWDELDVVGI